MFLTDEEIADLTGLKRGRAQYQWLRDRGWPVELDARKRPRLLREVVQARMGGIVSRSETRPNWAAINGTP